MKRKQGFAPLSLFPSLPLWPTVPAVSRRLRVGVDSRNCRPGVNITAGPLMTLTHGKAHQTQDYIKNVPLLKRTQDEDFRGFRVDNAVDMVPRASALAKRVECRLTPPEEAPVGAECRLLPI